MKLKHYGGDLWTVDRDPSRTNNQTVDQFNAGLERIVVVALDLGRGQLGRLPVRPQGQPHAAGQGDLHRLDADLVPELTPGEAAGGLGLVGLGGHGDLRNWDRASLWTGDSGHTLEGLPESETLRVPDSLDL